MRRTPVAQRPGVVCPLFTMLITDDEAEQGHLFALSEQFISKQIARNSLVSSQWVQKRLQKHHRERKSLLP